jgi:hypothetical protein
MGLKWHRLKNAPGQYADAPGGRYVVTGDGADCYVTQEANNGAGVGCGLNTEPEWEVLFTPDGGREEQLLWTPRLRDGKQFAEEHNARRTGDNPKG